MSGIDTWLYHVLSSVGQHFPGRGHARRSVHGERQRDKTNHLLL